MRSFRMFTRPALRAAFGIFSVCIAYYPEVVFAQKPKAAEIWLRPNSRYEVDVFQHGQPNHDWSKTGYDFHALFSDTNKNDVVVKNLSVVELSPAFINRSSLAELRGVYQWIQYNHLQLAVEVEMLDPNFANCGEGVEGFSKGLIGYLTKLKHAGVSIRYFVMDEPLFFGSLSKKPKACQAPLFKTAQNIAQSQSKIKSFFPDASIAEIEPMPQVTDLVSWLGIYHKFLGSYPSVIFADVSWKRVSNAEIAQWSDVVRRHGIKFGLIYDAANAVSDEDWENQTLYNAKRIKEANINLDVVLFDSWAPYPRELLPENRFGTMTNTIKRYLEKIQD